MTPKDWQSPGIIAPAGTATPENPVADDAAALIAGAKVAPKLITLPSGQQTYIRAVTSTEITDINKRIKKETGGRDVDMGETNFREWVVIYGTVKANGDQMFGSQHLKDLKSAPVGFVGTLFREIISHSGIGEAAVKQKVEELEADPFDS